MVNKIDQDASADDGRTTDTVVPIYIDMRFNVERNGSPPPGLVYGYTSTALMSVKNLGAE